MQEVFFFSFYIILTLPYHKELLPLQKLLKSFSIDLVFRYDSTIRNYVIKNSPNIEETGGVYYIPCKICDKIYIGQTGKHLSERLKQHKYNVRTAVESSAVFKHQETYNHNTGRMQR